MAITINGNGTLTGVSVGGLPDGIVDTDMLAANAVTDAKRADEYSSSSINIGGIRIMQGTYTTASSTSSSNSSMGVSCQKYVNSVHNNILSGFASTPIVTCELDTDHHDASVQFVRDVTTTDFTCLVACSRDSGITSKTVRWIAIGEAS